MAQKKAKKKTVKRTVKKTVKKPMVSARSEEAKRKLTRPLAIVAFLLNVLIFVLPGIGSLIGGKTKQGIWQLVIAVIGIILSMTAWQLLGFPLVIVSWIWGIVTGVEILRESE